MSICFRAGIANLVLVSMRMYPLDDWVQQEHEPVIPRKNIETYWQAD